MEKEATVAQKAEHSEACSDSCHFDGFNGRRRNDRFFDDERASNRMDR